MSLRASSPIVATPAFAAVAFATTAHAQILVYDHDAAGGHALAAAAALRPGEVTRARAEDFNALLPSRNWELVVLDFPGARPHGGMGPLIDYVRSGGASGGGGRVILSTWHQTYDDALFEAFGALDGERIHLTGARLFAAGTPAGRAAFAGVALPWDAWLDRWSDDGVAFESLPGAEPLGFLNTYADPVAIMANDGRTIATFLLDEWDGPEAARRVWTNMMDLLLQSCAADLDLDGALTIFDFLEFQNRFDAGDPRADFDGDGSLTVFDFLAFQNAFDAGCP